MRISCSVFLTQPSVTAEPLLPYEAWDHRNSSFPSSVPCTDFSPALPPISCFWGHQCAFPSFATSLCYQESLLCPLYPSDFSQVFFFQLILGKEYACRPALIKISQLWSYSISWGKEDEPSLTDPILTICANGEEWHNWDGSKEWQGGEESVRLNWKSERCWISWEMDTSWCHWSVAVQLLLLDWLTRGQLRHLSNYGKLIRQSGCYPASLPLPASENFTFLEDQFTKAYTKII